VRPSTRPPVAPLSSCLTALRLSIAFIEVSELPRPTALCWMGANPGVASSREATQLLHRSFE